MRVAFYNQMFAMNGQSFFANLFGHWAVHFQNQREREFTQELIWKEQLKLLKEQMLILLEFARY